jgi:hypothetical protein
MLPADLRVGFTDGASGIDYLPRSLGRLAKLTDIQRLP